METLVNNTLGQLMERNLLELFGEPNSERRRSVIDELYMEHCVFFETSEQIVGRTAQCKGGPHS
jgi:hypothetical protein